MYDDLLEKMLTCISDKETCLVFYRYGYSQKVSTIQKIAEIRKEIT